MKKRSYILLSIIIMILLLSSCDPEKSVSPTINVTEPEELSYAAQLVEEALLTNDIELLTSMFLPKYIPVYQDHLESSLDKNLEIGIAFNKRRLIALDRIYAVYQIEFKGRNFEISFSLDNEGQWKLMNF